MAYGQKQTFVATPQPGTSNLPYATTVPKGGLSGKFGGTTVYPPFVPVVINVHDYYGSSVKYQTIETTAAIQAAILELIGTSTVPGTLGAIDNKLDLIAEQLTGVANTLDILNRLMIDYKTNLNATVSLNTNKNISQSFKVSNQINTNRFYKIANGENPVLPPLPETLKEILKKYKTFNLMVETEGLIKSGTDKLTGLVKVQMTAFDDAFGITAFLKEKAEVLKTALLPSTRGAKSAIESKTKVTWT